MAVDHLAGTTPGSWKPVHIGNTIDLEKGSRRMAECQSKRYPPLYPRCHILAAKAQSSLKKLLLSSQLVSEETTSPGDGKRLPARTLDTAAACGDAGWEPAGQEGPAWAGGRGPCGSSTPPPSGLRAPPGPGQRSPACPPPGSRTWRRPANPLRRLATAEPPWAPSPESQHAPAHPDAAESLPRRRRHGLQLPRCNARPRVGSLGGSPWSMMGDVVLPRHRPAGLRASRAATPGLWAGVRSAKAPQSLLPLRFS